MVLSHKFEEALRYAAHIHAGQSRKGTEVPVLAHLLGVASLVIEHGGVEDQAIAALLHDAAEDAGGKGRLEDIRSRFGDTVADIVEGCTDTLQRPKPQWRARKAAYIAKVPKLNKLARLVAIADKLHNGRAILRELRASGENVWSRFKGGRDGTLWYYRCLVQAFRAGGVDAELEELDRVVTQIEALAKELAQSAASAESVSPKY